MMKLIPQTAPIAFGLGVAGAIPTGFNGTLKQPQTSNINNNNLNLQASSSSSHFKLNEDASEIINFVLSGGPKWGFRIRQLNDNRVIVSKVNRGGPAEKSGLKVNDEILSVNQVPIAGNQPRSLLLQDHPEQQLLRLSTTEKSPLLPLPVDKLPDQQQQFPSKQKLELSRIDFAYQLIKHSGISSNLLISVKRYLNPIYARASVAASNMSAQLMSTFNNQISPSKQTPSLLGDEELLKTVSSQFGLTGRQPTSVHYAYKCCECYCDNEASNQSGDEEDERRLLLLQLRNQQRQKHQARLEEEQQRQKQREQQKRQEEEAPLEQEQEEEPAPEVPVRRSSQAAGSGQQQLQYSQVMRPARALGRPSQPPPPPPPPPPRRDLIVEVVGEKPMETGRHRRPELSSTGSGSGNAIERPARQPRRAPKDIWSPSSSSLTSSSCEAAAIAAPRGLDEEVVGEVSAAACEDSQETTTQPTVIGLERHLPAAGQAGGGEGEADEEEGSTMAMMTMMERQHQQQPTGKPPPPSQQTTGSLLRRNEQRLRTGSVDRCGRLEAGGSRPSKLRSFSIATSTLAGEKQASEGQKYWTLPGNSAASNQENKQMGSSSSQGGLVVLEEQQTTARRSYHQQVTKVTCERLAGGEQPLEREEGSASQGLAEAAPSGETLDLGTQPYKQTSADEQPHCLDRQNNYRFDDQDNENIYCQELDGERMHQQQRKKASNEVLKEEEQQATGGDDNEWFRQMYKKMHQSQPRQTDLFKTLNNQPDTTQIKIKLKSPKSDHRYSPSYYSEEDFPRASPFKPGNISDYLPGQSSISQHERNLILYHKLIDHINKVFSSVLPPELTSRSYHTLQAKHYHSSTLKARQAQDKCQQRQQASKSGPQTPVSTLNRRQNYYREPVGYSEYSEQVSTGSEHETRCVFNRLLNQELEQQQPATSRQPEEAELEPRKQYVAVQHGHDIPLKGLRKPAPQASFYKDQHLFSDDSINIHYKSPTGKLLKTNTFNEFELSRIKKLYADELESKLQRSKSGRLPPAATSGGDGSRRKAFSSQRRKTQSAERLPTSGGQQPEVARQKQLLGPEPAVDLHRYQRAFLTRRRGNSTGSGRARPRERSKRFGRALFDFQAKSDRELSLRRGDLLEMLQILDHSWALVEDCQSGLQGLVPLNYIDYSVGCAVALRDVCGQQRVKRSHGPEAMLSMNKGEPITLIRRLSGHLYEASNTRQAMGLVWSNDLEIIKQPVLRDQAAQEERPAYEDDADDDEYEHDADEETGNDEDDEEEMLILESGERVLARRRRRARSASTGRKLGACCAMEELKKCQTRPMKHQQVNYCCQLEDATECLQAAIQGCHLAPRRSQSSPYIASQLPEQLENNQSKQTTLQTGSDFPRLARAKFAYKPRQRDELELVVGDILVVVYECDDGWLIGSSYATKQTGTFPGNFVEPI